MNCICRDFAAGVSRALFAFFTPCGISGDPTTILATGWYLMSILTNLAAVSTGLHANYTTVLLFILFGIFFANLAMGIAKLVRPAKPGGQKAVSYECGELPRGTSWVRFNLRFYLIALFFIVFDVEVVFLYPWAVVFKELFPVAGSLVFTEMLAFILILVVGLAYVWAKGDLNWVKTLARRQESEVSGE